MSLLPPWDRDDPYREGAALLQEIQDWILRTMQESFPPFTEDQERVLREALAAAATHGWEIAKGPDTIRASKRQIAAKLSRRATANATHAEIRREWDRALKATGEADAGEIAKRCGVSRATVYRAVR